MQVPPEISLRGVENTPLIEQLITREISKLEQIYDRIITAHIAIELVQKRHKSLNPHRIRIYITIPDHREIIVERYSVADTKTIDGLARQQTRKALETMTEPENEQPIGRAPVRRRRNGEEPLPAMIRRAFDSARRELKKMVEKQRGQVKSVAQEKTLAIVEKLFPEKGHGFLRAMDGEQVYFHKNSVPHAHWEDLTVGTVVRYNFEVGEKGLQATTVEPVQKQGAAEAHGNLHELPELVSLAPKKKRTRKTAVS